MPQLDLLRGIAVIAVIAYHYPAFRWFDAGWAGVGLFFVLSGFLISGLLFADYKRNGKISIGRFLIRRGFKIYPPFYVFLLVTVPFLIFIFGPRRWPSRLFFECFFLQDYLPHLWPHTWSLAVEEQFYLLLPPLLVGLSKLRRLGNDRGFVLLPAISVALLLGCLLLRLHANDHTQDELRFPLNFRADPCLPALR